MKAKNVSLFTCLCLSLTAGAQTLDIDVAVGGNLKPDESHVYVRPISQISPQSTIELKRTAGDTFAGQVGTDTFGIYYLYSNTPNVQMSIPVYVDPKITKQSITISDGPNYITNTSLTDAANTALGAYASCVVDKAMTLGNRIAELSDSQIKALIGSYITDADSIVAVNQLPGQVKDFIKLWGYTSASDAYSLAGYLTHRRDRKLGFKISDVLPPAQTVLDTPMAAAFPSSTLTIVGSLPKGTIEEQLTALNDMYKTDVVRGSVVKHLVNSFMDKFDYTSNYEDGEKRLIAICEQYSLPETFVETFRTRRATVPGAEFPDVTLLDKDGNKVDFSKFKGKYVYVDLWASWCGPCCREVPSLQALEKEFEGSDVEFVSISIDSTEAPWLKKMAQLNMHGNQLWNKDGSLPKKLNVKGIPHFLIYGPDGKLHTYKATRPSDPETKELLSSLK